MDFIGLLGLLGLSGFFYGQRVNGKIKILREEVRRNSSAADFANLRQEIDKLNYLFQSCVTSEGLNNFARQIKSELVHELQREMARSASLQTDFTNFQNKIITLEKALEKICAEFDARFSALESKKIYAPALSNDLLEQKISTLEKNYAGIDARFAALESKKIYPPAPTVTSNNLLEQKISVLENENKALIKKFSEQNAILLQWQNSFTQVQNNLNELQKQVSEQQKIIALYELRLKDLPKNAPITAPHVATPAPQKNLTIYNFQIKKTNAPLFSNNPADVPKTLAVIENLTEITDFLESSTFDKKEDFISLIKNYRRNLKKFIDKVRSQKFDEDAFSEEASGAFFDTLSNYFLSILPVSIYRGNKENFKFYSDLLEKVNKYLAACRVYTEFIEPKNLMKHDDIEKMDIVKKDTADKSQDKIIDEVERLPYFLDYLTSDDDTEHFQLDGKMVVFKFDGGKK